MTGKTLMFIHERRKTMILTTLLALFGANMIGNMLSEVFPIEHVDDNLVKEEDIDDAVGLIYLKID